MSETNKIDDGGPAFPCGYHPEGNSADQCGGLSVRDYFAAKAMAGLLSSPHIASFQPLAAQRGVQPQTAVAMTAYEQADAMLAARKQPATT